MPLGVRLDGVQQTSKDFRSSVPQMGTKTDYTSSSSNGTDHSHTQVCVCQWRGVTERHGTHSHTLHTMPCLTVCDMTKKTYRTGGQGRVPTTEVFGVQEKDKG